MLFTVLIWNLAQAKAQKKESMSRWTKYLLPVIGLIVLLAAGFFFLKSTEQKSATASTTTISAQALEEQYGLRVNLVAVTAAGGMVDLRLKLVDAEKAKLLLQDKKNFPSLYVPDADVTLQVPQDTKDQEIEFKDDGSIFLMFPNAANVVKRGAPVTVKFGDIALEPIEAK